MKKVQKSTNAKSFIYGYIEENIKEYLIVVIVFFIGIVASVLFINNLKIEQKEEISSYINEFITSIKNTSNTIDKAELLKDTVKSNVFLTILLWFAGCTVIGMPIVYIILAYKGFSLSYTIASLVGTLGQKGILLSIGSLLIHNIVFIPTIFILSVSGIKLYKSIMKDRRKENIKLQICRHSIVSVLLGVILIFSGFIQVYVSTNILQNSIQHM